jgi:hypothetical protein
VALLINRVTIVLVALTQPVVVFLAAAQEVNVPAFVPDGAVVAAPPVEAVYQSITSPTPAVAVAVLNVPSYV